MADAPLRIALVAGPDSRGLGPMAEALREEAEVTLIGGSDHDPAPSRASAYSEDHWWSIGVLQALRRAYGDRGPDILEVTDRGGAAAVCLQAKLTLDSLLRDTAICVRLEGTREIGEVLDGAVDEGFQVGVDHDLERYALRHADRLLASPSVMEAYRSFYDGEDLAPDLDLWPARVPLEAARDPAPGLPLRLLCPGPIARREGVAELVSAVLGLERQDWQLTICGGDTPTGPLGHSMREVLALEIAGDPRVAFADDFPRRDLPAVMADHDVAVIASAFEADPATVLDLLACNRPVLAPAGGVFVDLLDEASGWLVPRGDEMSLRAAIAELLDQPEDVRGLIASQGPRRRSLAVSDPAGRVARLRGVGMRSSRPPRRLDPRPLVSVVIPYHGLSAHVEETIASVLASSYQPLEAIIVNDGSFEPEDELLMDLDRRPGLTVVHQVNAGPSVARNTGFGLARGKYILPLDADDVLGAAFIERCVDVMETHPEYAYVTCWARHMGSDGRLTDDAYVFLGNEARTVLDQNVAGTPASLLRAEHLDPGNGYTPDLVTHEDWHLYRTMHQRGLYGHVIPEFLFFYRLRDGSMSQTMLWPNQGRLVREVRARSRQREVTWTPTR